MQVEVYLDVVFAINVIMDFFIFWIVNKLTMKKSHIGRLVLGAVVASLFYCVFVFFEMLNIMSIVLLFVGSIYIAFKPKSIKEGLKLIVVTNIVAFAMGGVMIGIFYYTNIGRYVGNNIDISIDKFPIKILLSSICFSYIVIKLCLGWYNRVIIKKQTFYDIKLYSGGKFIQMRGLVDTGNSLREPITKKPVMVAEVDILKNILPRCVYEDFIKDVDIYDIMADFYKEGGFGDIKIIPFSCIGKKNGVLLGLVMDKAVIEGKVILEPIIALYNIKLSNDGYYNALLSPEFMGGGQINV